MSAEDVGDLYCGEGILFVGELDNREHVNTVVTENVLIETSESEGSERGGTWEKELGEITPGKLGMEVMLRQFMQESAKRDARLDAKLEEFGQGVKEERAEVARKLDEMKVEMREREERAEVIWYQKLGESEEKMRAEREKELRGVVSELREEQNAKITRVETEIGGVKESCVGNEARVRETVDKLSEQQSATKRAVNIRFKEQEEETSRVRNRTVTMENALISCEGKVNKCETEMAEIRERMGEVETKVAINVNSGGWCSDKIRATMRMSRTYRENDIPKFRGTEGEHPCKHLEKLKDFFALYECDEVEKVFVAKRSILGRCVNWLAMCGRDIGKFAEFERRFLCEYWDARTQGRDRAALYQEICRVGGMEEHLVKVVERAGFYDQPMSETDIITLVYSHTPKEVKRLLVGKEFRTVAKLREILTELDQLGEFENREHADERWQGDRGRDDRDVRGNRGEWRNNDRQNQRGNGGYRGYHNVSNGYYHNRGGYHARNEQGRRQDNEPGRDSRGEERGDERGEPPRDESSFVTSRQDTSDKARAQQSRDQQGAGQDERSGNGRGRAA